MNQRIHSALTATFWTVLLTVTLLVGAEAKDSAEQYSALTTQEAEIPVDELELVLKALTKQQLLVEAAAWLDLLQAEVAEIAKAEIAIKRHNQQIANAEEVQEQAEETQQQLDELQDETVDAKATGDAAEIREAEQATADAQESVEDLQQAVEETVEAAQRSADVQQRMAAETREGGGDTSDAASEVRTASREVKQASAAVELDDAAAIQQTAAAGEQLEAAATDDKVALLETLSTLREERTQLIDNLKAVIAELKAKTPEADSGTLAEIEDYQLYIRSVRGIELEIGDTLTNWTAITGWLTSPEGGLRWLKNLAVFLLIIFIAWAFARMLSRIVRHALGMSQNISQLLEDFLVGSVRWVVMAIGIIMALAALEVSVGPLLAVVGAAGFVIAFALQDSLSNFASGIMILFFRPFDVDDVIEAGGVYGKVTTMNLVSTTIKTFDNKRMVVPNNKIWQDVITNVTGVPTRRVDFEFGIGYQDDTDHARKVLEEIVSAHPKVLKAPAPTIRINTLADSSVVFICRPWARTEDYWDVYWDVVEQVKRRFDAEGIGIPYPQRDVHLYIADRATEEKLAAGVAAREDPSPSDR